MAVNIVFKECSTIVGILTFMSRINFDLSRVENEKSFITSKPEAGNREPQQNYRQ